MKDNSKWNPQFVLHSIPIKDSEQSSGCALASKVKWRLEQYAKRRVTVFCKTCKTLEDCGPIAKKDQEVAKIRARGPIRTWTGTKVGSRTANGDTYEGGLKNGHLHGKGTFTWLMGISGTSMKVNGRMASNTAEAL